MTNTKMPTGEIEVACTDLVILSEAKTPPFPIEDDVDAAETIRLKYRYLDLRRPSLQKNLLDSPSDAFDRAQSSRPQSVCRSRNTDPLQVDSRRRARFHRAVAPQSGNVLRASAISADSQAAADDLAEWIVTIRSLAVSATRTCAPIVSRSFRRSISSNPSWMRSVFSDPRRDDRQSSGKKSWVSMFRVRFRACLIRKRCRALAAISPMSDSVLSFRTFRRFLKRARFQVFQGALVKNARGRRRFDPRDRGSWPGRKVFAQGSR